MDKDIFPDCAPNFWLGSTTPTADKEFFRGKFYYARTFVSIEPILEPFTNLSENSCDTDWIIIGAETGNRKGKVIPEKSWIMELIRAADKHHTPIFMKESIRELMGDDFRQEFPWDV